MDALNRVARVGGSRRNGLELLRDPGCHFVVFHVLPDEAYWPTGREPSPADQVVVSEGDFAPDAA